MIIDEEYRNREQTVPHSVFTVSGPSPPVHQCMFNSTTLERGQFELDDVSKFRMPRHRAKECIQSYQLLPGKIRQVIKLGTAIALLSTVALVALFYFSKISAPAVYNNDISANEFKDKDQASASNFIKKQMTTSIHDETANDEDSIRIPMKIFKDIQGKARAYDHLQNQSISPSLLIPPAYIKKIIPNRRQWKHPATAEEISKTLEIVRDRVDQDRKKITSKELRLWEPGTEPMRILLVSTWRSGSTFLGSVIQSHPGVFQHYEPLSHFGIRQIRSGKDAFQAQQLIHRLLDCQYTGLNEYLKYLRANQVDMLGHNKYIHQACKSGPNDMVCQNETFLGDACKLFPIKLVKSVRMRLNITQLLLNDEKLRAKVIFLVRDPRGIMSSRYSSVKWCSSNSECASPAVLCEDMQGDLKVATAFKKLYPERFISLKYEDLAENPEEESLKLFTFLGLEYTEDTAKFIQTYTTSNFDAAWSIRRKSVERISLWKKLLPLEEIHDVQNSCEDVMKTLNYEIIGG